MLAVAVTASGCVLLSGCGSNDGERPAEAATAQGTAGDQANPYADLQLEKVLGTPGLRARGAVGVQGQANDDLGDVFAGDEGSQRVERRVQAAASVEHRQRGGQESQLVAQSEPHPPLTGIDPQHAA